MVLLARNNASTCLLVVFLLSNSYRTCSHILVENAETTTGENVARPEVRTLHGAVLGMNMVTHHNRTFFGFKGIPFAQPPVGNLRFKAPVPANPWNGTLDGSRDTNVCPQLNGNTFIGDEDCLYLNVYTPKLPAGENSTLLPVMMFVFGGGFKTGTNNPERWGPQFILNKDVVLVVPNYRMGVLGYLSTGDEASPGNYGLKDLVQALKWIQENVHYFGGDSNQVTIFGGSSGGICVQLLTLSNSTNGLFHRYITQSGSALTNLALRPQKAYVNRAIQLGMHLGCSTNTTTSLVDCLRGFNAKQLVDIDSVFCRWYVFPQIGWGPTVEPDAEDAVLTDMPANLLAAGKVHDLPWICEVSRDDGIVWGALFYEKAELFQELLDNLDFLLPIILHYDGFVANNTAYTAALRSYYLNDLSASRTLLLTNLTQLIGDAVIINPSYTGIQKLQLIDKKSPKYFCSFEYRGNFSYSYFFTGGSTKNWGVAHGDELLYLLPGPKLRFGPPEYEFSETDWDMVDTMVELWTSFAINGAPTTLDPNSTVVWKPYSSSTDNYLQIGNGPDPTLTVKHGFFVERMRFWKELNAATSWL